MSAAKDSPTSLGMPLIEEESVSADLAGGVLPVGKEAVNANATRTYAT
ncbi:hypothetical protein G1C95_2380 [Bifidobacterium sp. DSM 109957]|uniref:Uncharacterized protein n=1 Tax=Bifidobacterium oedipodis TaxID=2675322 RepID=A0A7Y0HUH7_9BIFI|nr:hypothetical protein [Bifidobacterium sp. DSM 109957]